MIKQILFLSLISAISFDYMQAATVQMAPLPDGRNGQTYTLAVPNAPHGKLSCTYEKMVGYFDEYYDNYDCNCSDINCNNKAELQGNNDVALNNPGQFEKAKALTGQLADRYKKGQ